MKPDTDTTDGDDHDAAGAGVASDPLRVIIDLVAGLETGLGRAVIQEVVVGVAGGRAKARRLAQALYQRPGLLTDGRSPAPRAVGNLLIALVKAGAVAISAPVCTGCQKALRAMQRTGDNWYCGTCGPRPETCTACSRDRPVATRTRDGGPRCVGCPVRDEPDPVTVIAGIVAAADPAIGAGVTHAAILAAAPQPGQRRRLAWALEEQPDLLTGAGAQAPVPAVLRLIELLCESGAEHIVRPSCPRCGRMLALVKPRDGLRLCRNCVAKSRVESCAGCPAVAEPASRNAQGQPLCARCASSDPANHENCQICRRRRPVSTRNPDGPVCETCRPHKILTCSICDTTGPALISKTTGQPWCLACSQRWARCSGCGQTKKIRGGTRNGPLCGACTRPDPAFWRDCHGCGQPGRINAGRCARCTVARRLRELLGDGHGKIRPELDPLYQVLATTDRTATVAAWLDNSAAPAILAGLNTSAPLSHHVLDELADNKTIEHLRAVLVAIGTLPARDEQIARLQRWITHALETQTDPEQRQLLHRYAIWHQLRRLRGRLRGADATHGQIIVIEQNTTAATRFLDWLTNHDLTLATAGQGDLETWLISKDATLREKAGHFIRWASANKLTSLHFPAVKWGGPAAVIDTEDRWDQARRLLHDATLKPEDRVAGLLVILYAQRLSSISRLTLDDIKISTDQVQLRLGREPIVLPEPLDDLIRQVVADRHGHATIGDQGKSPWLFPGGRPGQPISPAHLGKRLHQIGIQPGRARSTALFQLAIDLPAALLARMLGIHISVAVQWQRASSGDWTSYAADVSRRNQP